MTVLPIVERELRVAARRRGTFRTRLLAALTATLVAAGIVTLNRSSGGFGGFSPGFILFQALGWLGFLFAVAAGVFLTSDCLSEERRDGTLGLLFLTDLRGYDVVLGKLSATSLSAAYGLLAVAPVFALAFLLGGVNGGQFWRLVLALGNSLIFSLSVGMVVSAYSRDSQKAMNGTLLVCAVFAAGLPLLDQSLLGSNRASSVPWLRLASPLQAFSAAVTGGAGYWTSLLTVAALSGAFLALSSRQVRRRIDETPTAFGVTGRSRGQRWRYGSGERRAARRRRLLEVNPILWLAGREAEIGRVAAILVGLGLIALALLSVTAWEFVAVGTVILGAMHGLLALLLNLWVASHASRFLVDGRRNGSLELLLVTPVSVADILRGHWGALCRTFRIPVLGLLVLQAAAGVIQIGQLQGSVRGGPSLGFDFVSYQMASLASGLVLLVTGLLALAWFGMWMGLTSQKVPLAVIKTLVFVWLIPWFVFAFVQGIGMFALSMAKGPTWLAALLPALLKAAVDVGFILYARARLRTRFREIVTDPDRAGRMFRPPPPLMASRLTTPVASPVNCGPAPAAPDHRSPNSDLRPPQA